MKSFTLLLLLVVGCFWGCALPPVKIESDEPLKVDINMRIDVYQHSAKPASTAATANTSANPVAIDPAQARRRRMEEIQNLKSSRLVGENRNGVLEIRTDPPGPYGDYVRRIVAEENSDRIALMDQSSRDRGVTLEVIQKEQGELWRTRSFRGEWIEIQDAEAQWQWQRKDESPP